LCLAEDVVELVVVELVVEGEVDVEDPDPPEPPQPAIAEPAPSAAHTSATAAGTRRIHRIRLNCAQGLP
jgi:hypothetical protein